MKVEINLNDQVKFKPTAKGLMLMVERDANLSLGKAGSKHEQYTYHLQKLDKNGCYKIQLWEFANYFGSVLYLGGRADKYLEDMNLIFEP